MKVAFSILLTRLSYALPGVVLFIGLALMYRGLIYSVEYQKAPVIEVVQITGKSLNERLVVVDLGHRQRPVYTSDRLIVVKQGDLACVAKYNVISRRWVRYALALPVYCRNKPVAGSGEAKGTEVAQVPQTAKTGDMTCTYGNPPYPTLRRTAGLH